MPAGRDGGFEGGGVSRAGELRTALGARLTNKPANAPTGTGRLLGECRRGTPATAKVRHLRQLPVAVRGGFADGKVGSAQK